MNFLWAWHDESEKPLEEVVSIIDLPLGGPIEGGSQAIQLGRGSMKITNKIEGKGGVGCALNQCVIGWEALKHLVILYSSFHFFCFSVFLLSSLFGNVSLDMIIDRLALFTEIFV